MLSRRAACLLGAAAIILGSCDDCYLCPNTGTARVRWRLVTPGGETIGCEYGASIVRLQSGSSCGTFSSSCYLSDHRCDRKAGTVPVGAGTRQPLTVFLDFPGRAVARAVTTVSVARGETVDAGEVELVVDRGIVGLQYRLLHQERTIGCDEARALLGSTAVSLESEGGTAFVHDCGMPVRVVHPSGSRRFSLAVGAARTDLGVIVIEAGRTHDLGTVDVAIP